MPLSSRRRTRHVLVSAMSHTINGTYVCWKCLRHRPLTASFWGAARVSGDTRWSRLAWRVWTASSLSPPGAYLMQATAVRHCSPLRPTASPKARIHSCRVRRCCCPPSRWPHRPRAPHPGTIGALGGGARDTGTRDAAGLRKGGRGAQPMHQRGESQYGGARGRPTR